MLTSLLHILTFSVPLNDLLTHYELNFLLIMPYFSKLFSEYHKMLLKCHYQYSYLSACCTVCNAIREPSEDNPNLSKTGHEGWYFVDYIASGFRQFSFCPVLYHMNELQQSHTPRTPHQATPLCFYYHEASQFSETVTQTRFSYASVASAIYFVTVIRTIFNMPRNVFLGHLAVLPML